MIDNTNCPLYIIFTIHIVFQCLAQLTIVYLYTCVRVCVRNVKARSDASNNLVE